MKKTIALLFIAVNAFSAKLEYVIKADGSGDYTTLSAGYTNTPGSNGCDPQ